MIFDFFYPPRCPVCDKYIENRDDILCEECERNILAIEQYSLKRPPLEEIWRLTRYKEGSRELIRNLKFDKKLNMLNAIEKILERAVNIDDRIINLLNKIDIAVMVPLHIEREKERGFNQAELIFDKMMKRQNIPIENLIIRIRATEHLYDKNLEERQKELDGAFALTEGAEKKVEGRNFLILDDIFTTGTTMSECAKILKAAGASEIYGLALASDFKYEKD